MSKKPKKNRKQSPNVRRSWGDLDPKTRVHKTDKDYDRKKNKKVEFDDLVDEATVDPSGIRWHETDDWDEDGDQE